MGRPVVHVEVVESNPEALRQFYGELFGWEFAVGDSTTETVSAPGQYGFLDGVGARVNGGVGGGPGIAPRALFYVGVDDVEAAWATVERLGGTRQMGTQGAPGRLVVGQVTDPEGNLVGVAGPA